MVPGTPHRVPGTPVPTVRRASAALMAQLRVARLRVPASSIQGPLYGLVFFNGVMTFRQLDEIANNMTCPQYLKPIPEPVKPVAAPAGTVTKPEVKPQGEGTQTKPETPRTPDRRGHPVRPPPACLPQILQPARLGEAKLCRLPHRRMAGLHAQAPRARSLRPGTGISRSNPAHRLNRHGSLSNRAWNAGLVESSSTSTAVPRQDLSRRRQQYPGKLHCNKNLQTQASGPRPARLGFIT